MNFVGSDGNEPAADSGAATTASASTEKVLLALAPLAANRNGALLFLAPTVDACPLTLVTVGGKGDFVDLQAALSTPLWPLQSQPNLWWPHRSLLLLPP